jgi:DNA-binding HxlR family transcriptional regulator
MYKYVKLSTINLIRMFAIKYFMKDIANAIESANNLSKRFAILSNNYRILLLAYLIEKHEATWSNIKQFLEDYSGSVNPNTLHFHLKTLIEADLIKRLGSEEKTVYSIGKIPTDISEEITEEIIKEKNVTQSPSKSE